MKNTIIGFLAGALIVASLNAVTPPQTTIFKPAQPKSWVVETGYSPDYMQSVIMRYLKQGYVVDKISGTLGHGMIVVMVKYY